MGILSLYEYEYNYIHLGHIGPVVARLNADQEVSGSNPTLT